MRSAQLRIYLLSSILSSNLQGSVQVQSGFRSKSHQPSSDQENRIEGSIDPSSDKKSYQECTLQIETMLQLNETYCSQKEVVK